MKPQEEIDHLRKRCTELHRRCQKAEAAVAKHVKELTAEGRLCGGNYGRALLACEVARLTNLVKAIPAAWRLRNFGYPDWQTAGGLNECRHGIAAGIPCERCDVVQLDEAYKEIQNTEGYVEPEEED